MKNNWQAVWNKRQDRFSEIDLNDQRKVFMELTRLDGFDITTEITYKIWMNEIETWQKNLEVNSNEKVFEVGCGSGAVLYKFFCDGFKIGGLDYWLLKYSTTSANSAIKQTFSKLITSRKFIVANILEKCILFFNKIFMKNASGGSEFEK